MELATPPPAARAPVSWYSWWLLPLTLGAGTVVTAAAGSDQTRIPAIVVGVVATTASAFCVRLLVRSQRQLRSSAGEFRTSQAEHSQQWQQHVAGLERKYAAERSAHDAQLAEQAQAYEARIVEQAQAWQEQLDRQEAAVALLAEEQLPDALKRLRAGEAIDDVLPTVNQCAEVSPDLRAQLRKILRTALIGVEEEFNRSTSAERAVISVGSRIHVLTSKLRGRLHEMQGEHGRLPAVAQGLMELDQEIGPADCLAASIGVLGGSDRPGRQWQEPQRLLSVVRGGIGRIRDFDRVQVRRLPELGVDGGLVDHLTLIFAHLLDNAARYSPPTEPVVVSGKEVPNGVGIEIQDSGKGLNEEKKREALQALDGTAAGPGLGGVSEDAHLGLRVVGALARRYGIRVTFADSPWLGTSVVVVVPHKYFTALPATVTAPAPAAEVSAAAVAESTAAAPAEPAHAPAEEAGETGGAGEAGDTTPGGLPRRRRRAESGTQPGGRPKPVVRDDEAMTSTDTASHAVPPDASFSGLAAFATAGREPSDGLGSTAGRESDTGRESTEHRTEESD
ncbi:sensor histidine kinase [Streptomyces sp. HC44]|uniref:histidine kinase n=1 Tax=Streptomyces scabichelini TaxID=2711217 RepID=A0A6G4UYL3_9ACTN|nr:ATP-binding protein [Streptomyces scabichelini]NGO06816.1 sensor histidine kinase [Streptomyces scabichelini]